MENHTFKIIEIVGTSSQSIEDAIQNAINKSAETVKNLDWFEVIETRGTIESNKIKLFQVILKIGLRVL